MLPLPCMLVCIFFAQIARETAGAASTRSSLRPQFSMRAGSCKQSSDAMRREIAASYSVVIVREGGRSSIPETAVIESISRGVLDTPPARGMTVNAWRETNATSIPRDDLALVPMNGLGIGQVTTPTAHQKFRTAGADGVVAAAPGGRFVVLIFRQ
jgi:hypothetical protein